MKTISASKAKWILRKELKSRLFWTRKILLFDKSYELVDELKLNLTPVQLGHGADCDDKTWVSMAHTMKAYIMMGEVIEHNPNLLFGFIEGYDRRKLKHAWNFFLKRGI
jgi:hypothetical protein